MSNFNLQATVDTGSQTVLLCDLSGSMESEADKGTRIQKLRKAVKSLCKQIPNATVVCFNDKAWVTHNIDREEPDGGTNLEAGLLRVSDMMPAKTIVVSDGQPHDPEAAIKAARRCSGVISCVYVGPDDDKRAIEFLQKLASVGAGECVVNDLAKAGNLLQAMRTLLCLPAPTEVQS